MQPAGQPQVSSATISFTLKNNTIFQYPPVLTIFIKRKNEISHSSYVNMKTFSGKTLWNFYRRSFRLKKAEPGVCPACKVARTHGTVLAVRYGLRCTARTPGPRSSDIERNRIRLVQWSGIHPCRGIRALNHILARRIGIVCVASKASASTSRQITSTMIICHDCSYLFQNASNPVAGWPSNYLTTL